MLHLLGGYVLRGGFEVVLTPRVLMPVAVALVVVLVGPGLAARVRFGVLAAGSAVVAAVWAVALALSSGWHRLPEPLSVRYEYPFDVPGSGRSVGSSPPSPTSCPPTPPTVDHPRRRAPAGALLAFVLLDRLGCRAWAGTPRCASPRRVSSPSPAVLVTVRAVADEATARVVAPFLVLAPIALWVATSADALFAGVASWGVAGLATRGRLDGPAARRQGARGWAVCWGWRCSCPSGSPRSVWSRSWSRVCTGRRWVGRGGPVLAVGRRRRCWWWWGCSCSAGTGGSTGSTPRATGCGPGVLRQPAPGLLPFSNLAAGPSRSGRRPSRPGVAAPAPAGAAAWPRCRHPRQRRDRPGAGGDRADLAAFYVWVLTATAFLPERQRRLWLALGPCWPWWSR